jgi:hypothetical protein
MPEQALVVSARITIPAKVTYDFKWLFLMLLLCIGLPDTLVALRHELSSVKLSVHNTPAAPDGKTHNLVYRKNSLHLYES